MHKQNRARYEYWLVRFYNRVTGESWSYIEEIPPEALAFLSFLDYETLIEPFLAEDLLAGHSRDIGPIRYGVSDWYARSVGLKYGAFPRKKNGSSPPSE